MYLSAKVLGRVDRANSFEEKVFKNETVIDRPFHLRDVLENVTQQNKDTSEHH